LELDHRIRALFAGPNFAHVATSMADGGPHVAPVWVGIEDDRPMFVKPERALSVANLRRDPRVAISIADVEDPYEEAHVRGRVVEFRSHEQALQWLDERSEVYLGSPYPQPPGSALTLVVVEMDRVGLSDLPYLVHTPPDGRLQLPRVDLRPSH
jgi:PPOX class probable F420-dependent enzyme